MPSSKVSISASGMPSRIGVCDDEALRILACTADDLQKKPQLSFRMPGIFPADLLACRIQRLSVRVSYLCFDDAVILIKVLLYSPEVAAGEIDLFHVLLSHLSFLKYGRLPISCLILQELYSFFIWAMINYKYSFLHPLLYFLIYNQTMTVHISIMAVENESILNSILVL